MKNKKGFTIAELTISLAVLSMIAVAIMTLTATTFDKTYGRRVEYVYKNECQNLLNCFIASDLTINDDSSINFEGFKNSIKYYLNQEKIIRAEKEYYEIERVHNIENSTGEDIDLDAVLAAIVVEPFVFESGFSDNSTANYGEFVLSYDRFLNFGSTHSYEIILKINNTTGNYYDLSISVVKYSKGVGQEIYALNNCYVKEAFNA